MQLRRTPLACAVAALATAAAQAQTTPERPALMAQADSARAQELPPVVVTGTPLESDTFQLVSPANVLQGEGLRLKVQPTLGETLGAETGVSQSYFGPNSSRPIIRGLDGDRIRVLQNGIGGIDASTVSFDHAVSLEPLLVDRVEVVRGPAALLYGGNAVGGVVNLIDGRIPQQGLSKPVAGAVDLRYDSVNIGRAGTARVEAGNERLVLHVDGFAREAGDLRIPGNAWTPAAQAQRGEAGPHGVLPNSASEADGFGIGGSLIFGDKGYTGLSYHTYNNEYGTVAEQAVKIDLKQHRWDFVGELRNLAPWVQSLKYKFGHSDYEHRELEFGLVSTTFKNKGYDSRVELAHGKLGPLQGALGVQVGESKISALGAESFLPVTKTENTGAFIYEEWPIGKVKLSLGGRAERVEVAAENFFNEADASLIAPAATRKFSPVSGAFGAFWEFAPQYGLAFNAAYTERAPVNVELFANGPHVATNAFEIGNPNLGMEKSTAFDLGLRKKGEDWSGGVGVFYNRFKNFVALLASLDPATGLPVFRDAADRTLPPTTDPTGAGYAEPIQQFQYTAVPAVFRGIEADVRFRVWEAGGNRVDLELRSDYTRAKNRDTDESLPRIPPLRYGGGLVYSRDRLGARVDALHASKQDKVPRGESTTGAYTMVNAALTYRMPVAKVELEGFIRGTNLLNEEARLATSFLRDIAPLGKRAVSIGLRGAF
jgi:iron complex outermembrane receptor protein